MKYVDEFRAPDLISKAGEEIRANGLSGSGKGTTGSWKFAEGTPTRFIASG